MSRIGFIAECENLPSSFWKSRFMLGHEQDYIFPDLAVMRDWSQLFHGTQSCFMSGSKSLANRMRIRRLLEPIAVLVERNTTEARNPFGLPVSSMDPDEEQQWRLDNSSGEDLPMTFERIRFFTGQLAPRDHGAQLTHALRVRSPRHVVYVYNVYQRYGTSRSGPEILPTSWRQTRWYLRELRGGLPPGGSTLPTK